MTKIMAQARAAREERKREQAEYAANTAQRLGERALVAAAKLFGEDPAGVMVPDGTFYRGQVTYDGLAIDFREDGDGHSRFFVMKVCPRCGGKQEKSVYSLADIAEVVDSEYVCMGCEVGAMNVATSCLNSLNNGERELAARLFLLLRETVRRVEDENEDE